MEKNKVLMIILVLAALDAAYLVASQIDTGILYCSTTGIVNCASVLNSAYSHVFGIPTSILGLIWALGALYIFIRNKNNDLHFIWTIAGAFGVLYSLSAMTLLQEICEYCLLLDVLILLSLFVFWKYIGKAAKVA